MCLVDVGEGEPQQIVCGAPNVAAGQTVAVARPGSIMPDGAKLKASKLRGVMSNGMICSEDELALATDRAGGIYVFPDEHAPGTPLADVLPISDDVLELEITPNRPDCLGLYGVAREVHAATGAPLGPPPWQEDPGSAGALDPAVATVAVETDLCLRFTARAFEGVTIAPSPTWLKARLIAAGQRPINNVVDITNYAMLLTGQPLHAFDLDRIAGGALTVRQARDGEVLTTLDGIERKLDPDVVLIEDADGPTSLAGVMGGLRSEVEPDTTRVLLEVACWDGPNMNRTMAKFNLRSEAGSRNEKGLAPEQTLEAQAVATRLMLDLTGATARAGHHRRRRSGSRAAGHPPARRTGGAPARRARRACGVPARPRGARLRRDRGGGRARRRRSRTSGASTSPARPTSSRRSRDSRRSTRSPARCPRTARSRRRSSPRTSGAAAGRRTRSSASGSPRSRAGSFTNQATLAKLRVPDMPHVGLVNPMSEAQAILRPTILGSLLDVAAHNIAHGSAELALFESAPVYGPGGEDGLADEHHALAALLHGPVAPGDWRGGGAPAADFYAVKGVLEHVLATLRVPATYEPAGDRWPFLHPGRSAAVLAGDVRLGFVGEVHPAVAAAWDLPQTAAVFAVDLGKVLAAAPGVTTYADLTSFPALRLDLAVVLARRRPGRAGARGRARRGRQPPRRRLRLRRLHG